VISSRDKEFEYALANPDVLEKRLAELRKQRKLGLWASAIVMLALFFLIFGSWADFKGGRQMGPSAFFAPLMLLLIIQQISIVPSSQSDMRILMVFRELREESHGRE
jgi:hypothetical protein